MKQFKQILIALLALMYISCDKSDPNFNLTPEMLEQTVWEGIIYYTYSDKEETVEREKSVNLFFVNKNEVRLIEGGTPTYTTSYTVNGGILEIENRAMSLVTGTWLVTEKSKRKMVLAQRFGTDIQWTMVLSRIHPQ